MKVKKLTNPSPHDLEAVPKPPSTIQGRLIQNEDRVRPSFGMKTVYGLLTPYGYCTQLRLKEFSTKTQFFLPNPDSDSTQKMPFRTGVRIPKNVFERVILIFARLLTTATRKRMNAGGHP